MKLKRLITLATCIMFGWIASAQQLHLILPFPAQPAIIIPGVTPFDIADLTGDSLLLGYLPITAQSNERQAVKAPIAKKTWLKNAKTTGTLASLVQIGEPVFYVINDISVGRVATGNYARLKATVYEKGITGYRLLKVVDTFVTDKSANINNVAGLGISLAQ